VFTFCFQLTGGKFSVLWFFVERGTFDENKKMEQHKSRLVYTIGMLTLFLCGAVFFLIGFFPASYSVAEDQNTVPEGRPTTLHGVE